MRTKTAKDVDFVANGDVEDFWREFAERVKVRVVPVVYPRGFPDSRCFDLDTIELRVDVSEFFYGDGALPTIHEFSKQGAGLRAELVSYTHEDRVAEYEITDVAL